MSCPHSTRLDADPKSCSLCIGAKPRDVRRDPVTGLFTIDGQQVVNRAFQPPTESRYATVTKRRRAKVGLVVDDEDEPE